MFKPGRFKINVKIQNQTYSNCIFACSLFLEWLEEVKNSSAQFPLVTHCVDFAIQVLKGLQKLFAFNNYNEVMRMFAFYDDASFIVCFWRSKIHS